MNMGYLDKGFDPKNITYRTSFDAMKRDYLYIEFWKSF